MYAPAATSAASRAQAATAGNALPASRGSTSRERAVWNSAQTGRDKQSPYLSPILSPAVVSRTSGSQLLEKKCQDPLFLCLP